jgi:hypothetical protein
MGMDPEDIRDTVMDNKFKDTVPEGEWLDLLPYHNRITINQNSSNASEWNCRLYGVDDFFFIPSKGNEPNWFWRAMQYILIGNKWSKK